MTPKINIFIDVGEAYDRLSILEVKKEKLSLPLNIYNLIDQINILQSQISQSIGWDLANEIFESKQYKRLKTVNKDIFDLIDKIREKNKKEIKDPQELGNLGIEIDMCNTLRFQFKNELQKKFFNDKTEEIKN